MVNKHCYISSVHTGQTQPRGAAEADPAAGGEDRREEVEGDGGHQAQGAAALHRAGERGLTLASANCS